MKIKALIFSIIFLNFINAFSQDITFESYIVDNQTFEPIENAIIFIKDLNIEVKSNTKGQFSFTTKHTSGLFVGKVKHKRFLTKEFLIEIIDGKPKEIDNILLGVTYKEGLKRRRITQRENINRARRQKKLLKERRKKEKFFAKQNKNSDREIVDYKPEIKPDVSKKINKIVENEIFNETQYKYSQILGVSVEKLSNNTLYIFIDKWINKPYNTAPTNTLFLEELYDKAYNLQIESSTDSIYNSEFTDEFGGKKHLREGDLLFFNKTGDSKKNITHVAIYLHNNKFVHDSKNSNQGVTISDLNTDYWSKRYVSAGRRINNQ